MECNNKNIIDLTFDTYARWKTRYPVFAFKATFLQMMLPILRLFLFDELYTFPSPIEMFGAYEDKTAVMYGFPALYVDASNGPNSIGVHLVEGLDDLLPSITMTWYDLKTISSIFDNYQNHFT